MEGPSKVLVTEQTHSSSKHPPGLAHRCTPPPRKRSNRNWSLNVPNFDNIKLLRLPEGQNLPMESLELGNLSSVVAKKRRATETEAPSLDKFQVQRPSSAPPFIVRTAETWASSSFLQSRKSNQNRKRSVEDIMEIMTDKYKNKQDVQEVDLKTAKEKMEELILDEKKSNQERDMESAFLLLSKELPEVADDQPLNDSPDYSLFSLLSLDSNSNMEYS